MIVTLTPNPSLDRTLYLTRLVPDAVNQVQRTLSEPSGKGVNVSVALRRCGYATRAVLPVGGAAGAQLVALLDAAGVEQCDVPAEVAIRSNISLVEADGTTTKINEAGPRLEPAVVAALLDAALAAAQPGDWVALCGSWPDGFDADVVHTLLDRCQAAQVSTALDTSGVGLRAIVGTGGASSMGGTGGMGRAGGALGTAMPTVVKPNSHELADLTGARLLTLGDVLDAGRQLVARGVATVLVSLGSDGAVLLERDGPELWGRAAVPQVANTAGAGDAFLAGYLLAADRGASAADRLASALRLGASAVQAEGTLFDAVDADIVVSIATPDPSRPLSEPAGV